MNTTIDTAYSGKRVLVTGHTGFKGSWLSLWLTQMGAEVSGFSLDVPTVPAAFELMRLGNTLSDQRGEIAEPETVLTAVGVAEPEIIFHLAAQPIVRAGFTDPFATFQANIMGTASVLEAARKLPSVKAVVIVTSDKVYSNSGSAWPFRESDPLGGYEPYGVSKAAAEIVTDVYRAASFHRAAGSVNVPRIASVRAGNVIGGGDWAANRLIPDFVRALSEQRPQIIRQPRATRPWQHVLEPLGGYLLTGAALLVGKPDLPPALNFGPTEAVMPDVEKVARDFLKAIGGTADLIEIRPDPSSGEAPTLRVESSLAMQSLHWRPAWSVEHAVGETAAWYRHWMSGESDMRAVSLAQLEAYRAATPVAALRQS